MIEYKIWEGKFPHVVILSAEKTQSILYYETGFEQLHPNLEIVDWMTERGYSYLKDWKAVRVEPITLSDWAICFSDKQACELFVLKWL